MPFCIELFIKWKIQEKIDCTIKIYVRFIFIVYHKTKFLNRTQKVSK